MNRRFQLTGLFKGKEPKPSYLYTSGQLTGSFRLGPPAGYYRDVYSGSLMPEGLQTRKRQANFEVLVRLSTRSTGQVPGVDLIDRVRPDLLQGHGGIIDPDTPQLWQLASFAVSTLDRVPFFLLKAAIIYGFLDYKDSNPLDYSGLSLSTQDRHYPKFKELLSRFGINEYDRLIEWYITMFNRAIGSSLSFERTSDYSESLARLR